MQEKKKGGFCLISRVICFIRWSFPPYVPYLKIQESDGRDPHSPHRCRYVCFWATGMWNGHSGMNWVPCGFPDSMWSLAKARLVLAIEEKSLSQGSVWVLLIGTFCLEKIILEYWRYDTLPSVLLLCPEGGSCVECAYPVLQHWSNSGVLIQA